MKHKRLLLALATMAITHNTTAIEPGDEVVAPDWAKKVEAIISASAGLKESFNQSILFYQDWRNNLQTPPEEMRLRIKQRKALIACIKKYFADRDTYAQELDQHIATLDKYIDELTSQIAFLELEISGKNTEIDQLKDEIIIVHTSYKELIGEDEDKARELMGTIKSLMKDYQSTLSEREKFRKNLEAYYKILHQYNADIRVDWSELEKEICKKKAPEKTKNTKVQPDNQDS